MATMTRISTCSRILLRSLNQQHHQHQLRCCKRTLTTSGVHVSHTASHHGPTSSSGTPASTDSTTGTYSLELQELTQTVDDLLASTRKLMDGGGGAAISEDESMDIGSTPPKHHVIAYSGGIDSSVVASLVYQCQQEDEDVLAVLGLSPAVPQESIVQAQQVAQVIGIPLELIPTTEGNDPMYIENQGKACLACKTHLYTCLQSIRQYAGNHPQLYNGTNSDDTKDPTRLGLIAAEQFQVQSPLQHTPKHIVRQVGKHMGLPNWNAAASPCLRSRLAMGVQAIPQHLQRIEQAERHVRQALELDATSNLRVRLLTNNRAMVEVDQESLQASQQHLEHWQAFFQDLGFASVNVRPFRSGSVAVQVAVAKE